MPLLLLGLFAAIFLHDAMTVVQVDQAGGGVRAEEALPRDIWPRLGIGPVLLIVSLPKLLLTGGYALTCLRTFQMLGTANGQRSLNRLQTMTDALPLVLLCLFITDLAMGGLRTVRIALQHTVLVDEVLVMLPTLLTVLLTWAMYYPVDRRLREATIIRRADAGRPVAPLLSRIAYVSMQLRHQFGLTLLPLLAALGWYETVVLLGPDFHGHISRPTEQALSPLGILMIFIGTPLVIRHVWQTQPLPPGDIRNRMLALCQKHGVRIRELLLWQTNGRMINAAVAGLVRPVRYILLSDGLLDHLQPREIEAVMAHELAHVKYKHLAWMGLTLIALLGTLEGVGHALLHHAPFHVNDPNMRMLLIVAPALLITWLVFGWVSRRIERQADVFAAKHLSETSQSQADDSEGTPIFDEAAVTTMIHALRRVAELNHIPAQAKRWHHELRHWRHGSIAWRQNYLRSLIGTPMTHPPIDHVVFKVKCATLLGLVATVLLYLS